MFRDRRNRLDFKILCISVALVMLAQIISGLTLLSFSDAFLEHILEGYMAAYAEILVDNIKLQNGEVTLNPAANTILSHLPRYWQISAKGKNLYKSTLLNSWIIPHTDDNAASRRIDFTDSDGTKIVALQTVYQFPGDVPVTIISGLDQKIAQHYLGEKQKELVLRLYEVMLGEAVFLVMFSIFLARYSTAPIRAVNKALCAIREGREERIIGNYPHEIRELTDEINHLLDYTSGIVGRYREFSGNLAHALKTPMSVIHNESDLTRIREKIEGMLGIIERNLARVQAAPSPGLLSAHTGILPVIEDICQGFGKLYGKSMEIDYPHACLFRGDKADLYEMLGNLIENACKFARSKVRISGDGEHIIIEDDGPDIPLSQRKEVLERGTRLDRNKPGTGIGLAIARDIAALYLGDITLESSTLSGLKVILRLPGLR